MFDYYALNILKRGESTWNKPHQILVFGLNCVQIRGHWCEKAVLVSIRMTVYVQGSSKGSAERLDGCKDILHHPENERVPSGSALLFEGNKAWHIFGREKMCFVIVFTRPLMPDSCLITTMLSTAGAQKARDPPSPSTWFSPQTFVVWPHAAAAAANHAPFTRRRKGREQSRPLMAALFGGRRRALQKKGRPF